MPIIHRTISKLTFATVMFLFLSQSIFAQTTGVIRGFVFEKESGEPLTGANVVLLNTSLGSATDLDGRYIIRSIPSGPHKLVVSYIGYNSVTMDVSIQEGRILEQNVYLEAKTIAGETITITAQAEGQLSAVNQQLSSNTIANIVSEARIKELPDVNAAESIGRLPGVSIERSGGEANKVSIRGLSPKYNAVTVNGVRLPATDSDNRSVDLGLISSTILDGITLKKANTPDMDADALGGTVDLRLKEAPEQLQLSLSAQGGYNKLQDYYGNYNLSGSVSNRFFNGNLGVILTLNTDNYDRSADKLSAGYEQRINSVTNEQEIVANSLNLREEKVKRGRTGASILTDYKIPSGKITLNSFYNKLIWDGTYHVNRGDVKNNRHYYDLEERGGNTSLFTGSLAIEQDFDWVKYDFGISRTATRNKNPGERTWLFSQENAAYNVTAINADTPLEEIPNYADVDTFNTALADLYIYDTRLDENESTIQLNLQFPFSINDQINGYIKIGGKLRWLNRYYDEEQNGRNGLQYGGSTGINNILTPMLQYLSSNRPDEWNWYQDSLYVRTHGLFPVARILSDYKRDNFINGDFPLGMIPDLNKANQLMDALFATGQHRNYSIGSLGRDYDGVERYQAAYVMAEINLTKYFTLIPGIRYEKDYSKYHGQRFRETTLNNIQGPPADLVFLETERNNEFWLPMVHLIVNPNNWLKIRLARTETLTRPDYIQYAPITRINVYQNYIRAANSNLKPSKSTNYDLAVSIYENTIGLFTISGFHKNIKDLIFQTTYYLQSGIPVIDGLNIPENWLKGAAPQLDTYINNPYPAKYTGFEIDWQTHFWYLPSFLSGMVLNVNYTFIDSEIEKQLYYNMQGGIIPGSRPPRRENILVDSSRVSRMPDQPAHILNVTLGYDYENFSARLSYLLQTDKVTYIDRNDYLDNYSGTYSRWDLTLQQKLDWGIQVFANFTNLNNRPDKNYRGKALVDPTYIEYYGFTMDLGIRYKL